MTYKNQWLDIVFEGRNKAYRAYELKVKRKTTIKALIIGHIFWFFCCNSYSLRPNSKGMIKNGQGYKNHCYKIASQKSQLKYSTTTATSTK
jgi:uncharacterized ubiquitin-like protein YukD